MEAARVSPWPSTTNGDSLTLQQLFESQQSSFQRIEHVINSLAMETKTEIREMRYALETQKLQQLVGPTATETDTRDPRSLHPTGSVGQGFLQFPPRQSPTHLLA
eukprot:CAMPEP_0178452530 /NCGR_PEP_ID=MMETSP0689_2-20121128/44298_1 /TAXON_ID=160604 /ORGANISM="Amphidinium massartii, Strain CS-259" /LENGTH=104 /DNA_ID=CAMNT_0020078251 /DNA_START=13 /DNA_END=324 /DNA_ORIENTATION=+